MSDFSTSFTVGRTPSEVYAAIIDVRGWWTGDIVGTTSALGDEFTYRHEDVHRSTQRVTELVPGSRVEWLVADAHLSFTGNPAEWIGTRIAFDISAEPDGTELRFTHIGLTPEVECFEACTGAWGHFINGSLRSRIMAG